MMQRAYARLHQHDVRAKQTKVCDAERTGFPTPAYASIEAKRNLVTTPAPPLFSLKFSQCLYIISDCFYFFGHTQLAQLPIVQPIL